MTWNLYDRLLASADSDQSICIEKESGATLTYAELAAISGRFAGLLAKIGVGPNHRVAAKVEKSVEAIALYLATLRRRGLSAAQHRLYPDGDRVFHPRRAADIDRV